MGGLTCKNVRPKKTAPERGFFTSGALHVSPKYQQYIADVKGFLFYVCEFVLDFILIKKFA